MEQQEKPQQAPPMPVLPRLDRLDRLLELLEEKHSMSGRHLCNPVVKKTEQEGEKGEEEDPRKSLTSALEEVHHKGTLMDRLAMLENRVLQLSLEMDEGNTSRSSTSTVQVSKTILGQDLVVSKGSRQDDDNVVQTKEPPPIQLPCMPEKPSDEECVATLAEERRSISKREKRKGHTKWMGWFRCGQERHWDDDFGPKPMESRSK